MRKALSLYLILVMALSMLSSVFAHAEGLPEYCEITVEVFDRGNVGGTDPTNNYYTDWIKQKVLEELNIGVSFVAVSRWEEETQLNNLMAAGTAPDISFTYNNDMITNFGEQGGLVDLTPYIDQGMLSNLQAFLGPDPQKPGFGMIYRNQNKDTGVTWSIPARRMNVAQINTFIRKDWLDKLGLPLPTTTEEYVDALRAFKAMDPAEAGVTSIIPYTSTDDIRYRAGNLLESFIDPDISNRDRWVNTVVDRLFLLPGYKEGVRLLNQMYNEGLLDPEFPLYTDDVTCDNQIKSGAAGSFSHNWDQPFRESPGLLKDLRINVPDAEIVAIDPFVNAAGKTQKMLYPSVGLNFFIPIFSKNPEAAVRYANWLAKFENRYYLQIGDEGVTHEMINGLPKMLTVEGEKIMNSNQNIDYTFMINGLDVNDPDRYGEALANSYTVDPKLIEDAYAYAMKDGRPAVVVPGVNIISAGEVAATLIDKGKTLMAQSITAKPEDFDKVWDDGIADWLASGAQEVLAENAEKYYEP